MHTCERVFILSCYVDRLLLMAEACSLLVQAPAAVQELAGSADAVLDPIPINPSPEEFLLLREQLMAKRAAAAKAKKDKKASKALAAAMPEAVASALASVHANGALQAETAAAQKLQTAQKRTAQGAPASHLADEQVGMTYQYNHQYRAGVASAHIHAVCIFCYGPWCISNQSGNVIHFCCPSLCLSWANGSDACLVCAIRTSGSLPSSYD